jgi:Tfp pilus assembly protein PilO
MPNRREQLTITLIQFYQQPVAKVSLELFLSIGTVIFFAIFAIRPTLITMSELVKEIEDKRELSGQLSQKIASLSTAQSEFTVVESRLVVLDEAIPSSPQLINALKIIEKLASENNVVISTLTTPEIPTETTNMSQTLERVNLPLTVSLTGDYLSIRRFVEALQASRRTFVVDTVTFTTSDERGAKTLRALVTLAIPYFGEPQ